MSTDGGGQAAGTGERGQLTVYLLRESITSFAAAVHTEKAGSPIRLRDIADLEAQLYVASSLSEDAPWAPFLRQLTVSNDSIPPLPSQTHSAALIVKHCKRFFAVVFGRGRYLLKPEAIERDYGLKSAAGMVDPGQIQTIESIFADSDGLRVRRQADEGAETSRMGLEIEHEMLRSVAGHLDDERIGRRVSGADGLSIVTALEPSRLVGTIDAGWRSYDGAKYLRRFHYIDWRKPVEAAGEIARLDQQMASEVKNEPTRLRLAIPAVLDDSPAVLRLAIAGQQDKIGEDLSALRPSIQSLACQGGQVLRHASITRVSVGSGEVLGSWPLYDCVSYERASDGGKGICVLHDGRWWLIDQDYVGEVDERLGRIQTRSLDLPVKCRCETENEYNARVAVLKGWYNFDLGARQFHDSGNRIEICDLFTDGGAFIHVKDGMDGSPLLSHLFGQASVSADLFQHLPAFRQYVVGLLAKSGIALPTWALSGARTDVLKHEVNLAIIRGASSEKLARDLPFFSRNQLARTVDAIERMGYKVFLTAIAQGDPVPNHDVPPFVHDHVTADERTEAKLEQTKAALEKRRSQGPRTRSRQTSRSAIADSPTPEPAV